MKKCARGIIFIECIQALKRRRNGLIAVKMAKWQSA